MINKNAPVGASIYNSILSASFDLKLRKYVIQASDPTPIFKGDFVKSVGLSNADGIPYVIKADDTDRLLGIVADFDQTQLGNLPLYREAYQERIVFVCDDPNVEFEMQVDGYFTESDTSKLAYFKTNSGEVSTGISNTQLDSTTFIDSVPLTAFNRNIKILGLSARGDNTFGLYSKVKCIICHHEYSLKADNIADTAEHLYFVGKHGDDDANGLLWEQAFATPEKAIATILALNPSETNRFTIFCNDSGVYDIPARCTIPPYTKFFFPTAKVKASFILSEGSSLIVDELESNNTTHVFTGATTGSETAYVRINYCHIPQSNITSFSGIGCDANMTVKLNSEIKKYVDSSTLPLPSRDGSIHYACTTPNLLVNWFGEAECLTIERVLVVVNDGCKNSFNFGRMTSSLDADALIVNGTGSETVIHAGDSIGHVSGNGGTIYGQFYGTFSGDIYKNADAYINLNILDYNGINTFAGSGYDRINLGDDVIIVSEEITGTAFGNAALPADASIPRSTEGNSAFERTFSPILPHMPIVIKIVAPIILESVNPTLSKITVGMALFFDSETGARKAVAGRIYKDSGSSDSLELNYRYIPTSKNPVTLKVRFGSGTAPYLSLFNDNGSYSVEKGYIEIKQEFSYPKS